MNITYYNQLGDNDYPGLVILDRDGTLIKNIKSLNKISEIEWLPERIETLKYLVEKGYILAMATNQGAIEEGAVTEHKVLELHQYIVDYLDKESVPIWAIAFCPHSKYMTGKTCTCRKPKSGMLDSLIKNSNIDWKKIYFIGDQPSDIDAAISSTFKIVGIQVSEKKFMVKLKEMGMKI